MESKGLTFREVGSLKTFKKISSTTYKNLNYFALQKGIIHILDQT